MPRSLDVAIEIELDEHGAIKRVKGLDKSLRGLKPASEKATSGMSKLKKAIGGLGLLIAARQVQRFASTTINAFAAYEREAINVQNITSMTSVEMKALADEILNLPPALGQSTDLMKGLYQALSAGVPQDNAIEFLVENAKAAKGNLADLTTVVDASSSVIAAYGLDVSETTNVLDAMTKTVDLGKLTFNELSANIGKGISIAAQAGVTYQELMGTLATLTMSGLSVEESMTGIRNILVATIKPQSEQAKKMKELNIEMSIGALKAKGLGGFMASLAAATKQNVEHTSGLFPNIRALDSAMALTSEHGGARLLATIEAITNSTGKVAENFARMSESTAAKMDEIAVSFERMKILIGSALAPTVIAGIGKLLTDLENKMPAIATSLESILTKTGEVLTTLSAWAPVLLDIAKGLAIVFATRKVIAWMVLIEAATVKMLALAAATTVATLGLTLLVAALTAGALGLAWLRRENELTRESLERTREIQKSIHEEMGRRAKERGTSLAKVAEEIWAVKGAEESWASAVRRRLLQMRLDQEFTGKLTKEYEDYLFILGGVVKGTADAEEGTRDLIDALLAEETAAALAAAAIKEAAEKAAAQAAAVEAEIARVKRAYQDVMDDIPNIVKRMNAKVMLEYRTLGQILSSGIKIIHMTTKDILDKIADDTDDWANIMASTFSDLLGKGFIGELETFADLWDSVWQDMAKAMSGILGAEFENWLNGVDANGDPSNQGLFSRFSAAIEGNRLAAGVGGFGMMMGGVQQGGGAGVVQGMFGGAMAGGAIGLNPALMAATSGMSVIIGAVIGAIIGGVAAYFGGEDTPSMGFGFGAGGFGVTSSTGQSMTDRDRTVFEQKMNSLLGKTTAAYRNLTKMFGDAGLFDLVGALGDLSISNMEGTAQEVAAWIADVWLPAQMETIFGQAISQGLSNLGLGGAQIENLWDELGLMPSGDRLEALQNVILALTMFRDVFEDFGSGDALLDLIGQSPMQVFAQDMADVRDAIDLVTVGWEDMSLTERAAEAQQIGTLFESALQNTLNMLQQIASVRQSVNQSFDRMDEDIRVGRMTDVGRQRFFRQRIVSLTGELGQAESAEEIARISAEIQRYMQSLMGVVDLEALGGDITGGQTWGNYIQQLIAQAQAAANTQLDEIEEEVLAEYDALIAAMQLAEEALTGFTEAVGGAGGAGGGGGANVPEDEPDTKGVNVTIIPDETALVNFLWTITGGSGDAPGAIE
jgi:TP901 family phage tail tape measure protein